MNEIRENIEEILTEEDGSEQICPNYEEIYLLEPEEEPECNDYYGNDGCPGTIEPDFIICEICGKELEDAEQEHNCLGEEEPEIAEENIEE